MIGSSREAGAFTINTLSAQSLEQKIAPGIDYGITILQDARRAGHVQDDQPVLIFEAGGETLVLVTSQMSYHHVAQGEMAGEPWMVTF